MRHHAKKIWDRIKVINFMVVVGVGIMSGAMASTSNVYNPFAPQQGQQAASNLVAQQTVRIQNFIQNTIIKPVAPVLERQAQLEDQFAKDYIDNLQATATTSPEN